MSVQGHLQQFKVNVEKEKVLIGSV